MATSETKLVKRNEVSVAAWDRFVERHPDGWWYHTWTWIDYALAYSPDSIDASTAYLMDGEVVAVVPLVLLPNGYPVFGGQVTPAPLANPEISLATTIDKRIKWAYRPGQEIEDVPADYVERDNETYVVDLLASEKDLWRKLRKSYKSLIHRAEEKFRVDVWRGPIDLAVAKEFVDVAHHLHAESAGRETRSQRTWDLQAAWLASGDAVLLVAAAERDLVGFAYLIRWKDWAYYASGAALQDDVSHLLLWRAMQALRADSETRYFEVGHAGWSNEKEKSIAFFKSGFGGEKWTYKTAVHQEYVCAS